MVNTVAEGIKLRKAEYSLCGIDDFAEVLQMGEEETEVFLMFFSVVALTIRISSISSRSAITGAPD